MNLRNRIEIELLRQDNELMREALEYIEITGSDSEALGRLHEVLDYHDLPIEYDALDKALDRLREDHTALIDRYDKLNDDYEALIDLHSFK